MAFYDEEYREDLARRKGFNSYKEYARYLLSKRKEKLEEFKKEFKRRIEEERKIREESQIELDIKGYLEEKEKIPILERPQEERAKYFKEQKLCKSLQRIVSEVKDEESIFKDIKFLEKYTGCKIKKKSTKRKS